MRTTPPRHPGPSSKSFPRSQALRALLKKGVPAISVSRRLKVSRRWVFEYAQKHKLPTSPPAPPGGRRELQLLKALASGFSPQDVARLFSYTPAFIRSLQTRAHLDTRRATK